MSSARLFALFEDEKLVARIRTHLPYLFQLAEKEASRAGKVGMEVGTIREQILIALFLYGLGSENVDVDIPITAAEVDVKVFGEPIAIRTVTGSSAIKVNWTVDPERSKAFLKSYEPVCHMLLAHVLWNDTGQLSFIPLGVQRDVLRDMGKEDYLRLPKMGTNPRGVVLSREALTRILQDKRTKSVDIFWARSDLGHTQYQRWVDLWKDDRLSVSRKQRALG